MKTDPQPLPTVNITYAQWQEYRRLRSERTENKSEQKLEAIKELLSVLLHNDIKTKYQVSPNVGNVLKKLKEKGIVINYKHNYGTKLPTADDVEITDVK